MYHAAELDELTRRKLALRQQIARTREQCAGFAAEAARPLALIDRVRAQWQRLSPVVKLAAIPLALLLRRGWSGRGAKVGVLRRAWRWLPVALSAARLARAWRPAR